MRGGRGEVSSRVIMIPALLMKSIYIFARRALPLVYSENGEVGDFSPFLHLTMENVWLGPNSDGIFNVKCTFELGSKSACP